MKSPPNCQGATHRCQLVVVTGGPGAGKTAVLEIAKRHFCEHIMVLPESAGIIFGGGFWRKPTLPARKAAQRAIFYVQRELETLVIEEGNAAIALCDRGTLDGLAYWPGTAPDFWRELGTTKAQELSRYAAVIHLRSPKGDQGYNLSNPVRIETPEQAAEIDLKIAKAWDGHPHRIFVESSLEFLDKVRLAMEGIRAQLPSCCQEHQMRNLKIAPRS